MELDLDEQQLVAEFRTLSPAARQELLQLATRLLRNCLTQVAPVAAAGSGDQSPPLRAEQRPAAADEPISTE